MKIITLTGCTSVGKDSIFESMLSRSDVFPIISTTSRPMRIGEVNGREYNFVSRIEAEKMLKDGKFIESRTYNVANGDKWTYGITEDSIDFNSNNIYIVIVDLKGLKELERYIIKRQDNKDCIHSVYIHASAQERLRRALNREGEMTDIMVNELCRRNLDDYKEVVPAKEYCDTVLVNEVATDRLKCVSKIHSTINEMIGE